PVICFGAMIPSGSSKPFRKLFSAKTPDFTPTRCWRPAFANSANGGMATRVATFWLRWSDISRHIHQPSGPRFRQQTLLSASCAAGSYTRPPSQVLCLSERAAAEPTYRMTEREGGSDVYAHHLGKDTRRSVGALRGSLQEDLSGQEARHRWA